MANWLSENYEIIRALHIIFVIAWMAGIMYLPRLFVNHSQSEIGSETDSLLCKMESRLYNQIMRPSMIIVWVIGIALIIGRGGFELFANKWFVVKFIMVVLITINHEIYGFWIKEFSKGKRPLGHVFFRIINEVPFILMLIGVFMVVLEPQF